MTILHFLFINKLFYHKNQNNIMAEGIFLVLNFVHKSDICVTILF